MPKRHRLLERRLGVLMIQPQAVSHADVADPLALLLHQLPPVRCITGDGVQSFSANVLLVPGDRLAHVASACGPIPPAGERAAARARVLRSFRAALLHQLDAEALG